jgi:hypothetical protein
MAKNRPEVPYLEVFLVVYLDLRSVAGRASWLQLPLEPYLAWFSVAVSANLLIKLIWPMPTVLQMSLWKEILLAGVPLGQIRIPVIPERLRPPVQFMRQTAARVVTMKPPLQLMAGPRQLLAEPAAKQTEHGKFRTNQILGLQIQPNNW